jgi:hypothetical protein
MDPLSRYVVVRYWRNSIFKEWEIYKQQYLNTVEDARKYIADRKEDDEDDLYEFKIFELKEVQ